MDRLYFAIVIRGKIETVNPFSYYAVGGSILYAFLVTDD